MNFLQKNEAYIRLKKNVKLIADKSLLKKKNPGSEVLTTKYFDSVRESKEVLYALLDVASEEEILSNRISKKKSGSGQSRSAGKKSTGSKAKGKSAQSKKDTPDKKSDTASEKINKKLTGGKEEADVSGTGEQIPPEGSLPDNEEKKSQEPQDPGETKK